MFKKILILFICFNIAIVSPLTFANTTSLGGWSISNAVQNGASRVYNGAKTSLINGANVVKTGVATIKPNAAMVSKAITRTGAVLAVDLAIKALIGGVDYVMDPANNEVVYHMPSTEQCAKGSCRYSIDGIDASFKAASTACTAYASSLSKNGFTAKASYLVDNASSTSEGYCLVSVYNSESVMTQQTAVRVIYNPSIEQEVEKEKRIPYDAVSEEIIDQAETDVRAGTYVGEAIDAELAQSQALANDVVNQFENTAAAETDTAIKPKPIESDPTAPPVPPTYDLPLFCSWAPSVCEAAIAVIKLPKTLTNWWDTAVTNMSEAYTYAQTKVQEMTDWFKKEPERDSNTEVDIAAAPAFDPSVFDDSRISASEMCPAPVTHSFDITGQSVSFSFTLQPVCDFLTLLRPALKACAYLYAAYIVFNGMRVG